MMLCVLDNLNPRGLPVGGGILTQDARKTDYDTLGGWSLRQTLTCLSVFVSIKAVNIVA